MQSSGAGFGAAAFCMLIMALILYCCIKVYLES